MCIGGNWGQGGLIFLLLYHRLEATSIPQDAQDRLTGIVEKLKADPGREKLDVNYLHHAQVVEKRNQTNVT